MSMAPSPQLENKSPEEAFYELRAWVDERLIKKGLKPGALPQVRHETVAVTVGHIERLKADIAELIRLEGRRNFLSGLIINALFFVLGLVAGAAADLFRGWLS